MHRDVARTENGTPFIEWKGDHVQGADGLYHKDSPEGQAIMASIRRQPPRQTATPVGEDEAHAREILSAAVQTAAKEYGCLAGDVRRPSSVPEIKRARARAASILLTYQNDDATGREFTPAEVAKMLQFRDPDDMVALVISAKFKT